MSHVSRDACGARTDAVVTSFEASMVSRDETTQVRHQFIFTLDSLLPRRRPVAASGGFLSQWQAP